MNTTKTRRDFAVESPDPLWDFLKSPTEKLLRQAELRSPETLGISARQGGPSGQNMNHAYPKDLQSSLTVSTYEFFATSIKWFIKCRLRFIMIHALKSCLFFTRSDHVTYVYVASRNLRIRCSTRQR
uniref:Uncharacterized protein n=1 Tax=Onchocerca volvulus TaxID=6282 RepID=A0A8R1Y3B2_ONCVO